MSDSSAPPDVEPGEARPGLWSVRAPLSRQANFTAGLLAFVIPFLLWCMVSYVPFVWHPLILI
ncbi:MAG TPA: hypothetical protein VGP93_00380, partial [Polyangiaceae bacterium]|nr:hypothetical protein [Polyangiaceae bacterium]